MASLPLPARRGERRGEENRHLAGANARVSRYVREDEGSAHDATQPDLASRRAVPARSARPLDGPWARDAQVVAADAVSRCTASAPYRAIRRTRAAAGARVMPCGRLRCRRRRCLRMARRRHGAALSRPELFRCGPVVPFTSQLGTSQLGGPGGARIGRRASIARSDPRTHRPPRKEHHERRHLSRRPRRRRPRDPVVFRTPVALTRRSALTRGASARAFTRASPHGTEPATRRLPDHEQIHLSARDPPRRR